MSVFYPAKYSDALGIETITIENDGKNLSAVIRDVHFVGPDFDSLEAQWKESKQEHLFTLHVDRFLCNCVLEFEMPLLIGNNREPVHGTLHAELELGKPDERGAIDKLILKLKLIFEEHEVISRGYWDFDSELGDIEKGMPEGYFIKCCHNCAFSDYSPYGAGLFGGLACFRDNKTGILSVRTKHDLFNIWNTMTEFVQETYLCSEFERKNG